MDAVIVMLVGVMLVVPFILARLWQWVGYMTTILVGLGVWELVAYLRTGTTLSQQFGMWRREHPLAGWCVLGGFLAAMGGLLWHLLSM